MPPQARTWPNFLIDVLFGWWTGLPSETCHYSVEAFSIAMRDGVVLPANLYRPSITPYGTIVIRTSFGISPFMAISTARMFAPRGYQVLLAATRGTDPSDGQEVSFGAHEGVDGSDTLDWVRQQDWYTGSFGMYGGSYLGFTQWAVMASKPSDMRCAVIQTGMASLGQFLWGNGAMDGHGLAWADFMTLHKRGEKLGPGYIKRQAGILQSVYDSVPLMEGVDRHFRNDAPEWARYMSSHPNLDNQFYKDRDYSAGLDAGVPVLQFSGYNDVLLPVVTEQYNTLKERGTTTFLTLGPWSHLGAQRGPTVMESLQFFDTYLAGRGTEFRKQAVKAFVTGAKKWETFSTWPPESSTTDFFLNADDSLSFTDSKSEGSASFTYDPLNPTPKIGQPRPFDDMLPASYDDTAFTSRTDVSIFTSRPLSSALTVLGLPTIELSHTTDSPHADLLVRLSEVSSSGKSTRVSDVYRRLDPNRSQSEPLKLTLASTAHEFKKGNRVRVILAGSAHPAFIRNLGTGENPGLGKTTRRVRHTIGFGSRLRLPVR